MKVKLIFISLILFLIFLIALLIYLAWPKVTITFSNKTIDWIEKKPKNIYYVNYTKVTGARGEFNINNQQMRIGTIFTAFGYFGFWKGNAFKNKYEDPKTGKTLIEITPNLIPGDGILQGTIVEKLENQTLVAYIFLEEDWKKVLGENLNIAWGKDFQNFKKFEWKELHKGIYYDAVPEDMNRFLHDFEISYGGIIVGDLKSKEEALPLTEKTFTGIGLS